MRSAAGDVQLSDGDRCDVGSTVEAAAALLRVEDRVPFHKLHRIGQRFSVLLELEEMVCFWFEAGFNLLLLLSSLFDLVRGQNSRFGSLVDRWIEQLQCS